MNQKNISEYSLPFEIAEAERLEARRGSRKAEQKKHHPNRSPNREKTATAVLGRLAVFFTTSSGGWLFRVLQVLGSLGLLVFLILCDGSRLAWSQNGGEDLSRQQRSLSPQHFVLRSQHEWSQKFGASPAGATLAPWGLWSGRCGAEGARGLAMADPEFSQFLGIKQQLPSGGSTIDVPPGKRSTKVRQTERSARTKSTPKVFLATSDPYAQACHGPRLWSQVYDFDAFYPNLRIGQIGPVRAGVSPDEGTSTVADQEQVFEGVAQGHEQGHEQGHKDRFATQDAGLAFSAKQVAEATFNGNEQSNSFSLRQHPLYVQPVVQLLSF